MNEQDNLSHQIEKLSPQQSVSSQSQPSLAELLAEMQKQTSLLQTIAEHNLALIDALADEADDDQGSPPTHYLDGTPCQ